MHQQHQSSGKERTASTRRRSSLLLVAWKGANRLDKTTFKFAVGRLSNVGLYPEYLVEQPQSSSNTFSGLGPPFLPSSSRWHPSPGRGPEDDEGTSFVTIGKCILPHTPRGPVSPNRKVGAFILHFKILHSILKTKCGFFFRPCTALFARRP